MKKSGIFVSEDHMLKTCISITFPRISASLIATLFMFGATGAWSQVSGDMAVVDTELLNMRSGPGTENPVVQKLPEGTRVQIKGFDDGWAQVVLDGDSSVTGWTGARFLKILSTTAPTSADAFFRELEAEHGAPDETGYLAEIDTHYASYCNNGFGIALFRQTPQPVAWTKDEWCVRRVSTKDIDDDGVLEIVYNVSGGGTGTFAVKEKFLHWPKEAAEPRLGFEFITLQVDQIASPFDVALELKTVREMHYGQSCRQDEYCPEWPPEAVCRPVTVCNMTALKEMRVATEIFPERLRDNPDWRQYVKNRYERDGFVLVGDDAIQSLDQLTLSDLEAVDDGSRPELTSERKALVDDWLN